MNDNRIQDNNQNMGFNVISQAEYDARQAKKRFENSWRQANILTYFFANMNTNEYKLLFYLLSMKKRGKEFVKVNYREFLKEMNIIKGGTTDFEFQNIMLDFYKRCSVKLKPEDYEPNKYIAGGIFTAIVYDKKTNDIEATFNEKFLPYFDDVDEKIDKGYIWLHRSEFEGFKTKYAYKMYLFAKTTIKRLPKQASEYEWFIQDFKKFFGIEKNYENTKDVRNRVLIPSINEINAGKNGIEISFSERRKGNKVISFILHFKENKKETEALSIYESKMDERINLIQKIEKDFKEIKKKGSNGSEWLFKFKMRANREQLLDLLKKTNADDDLINNVKKEIEELDKSLHPYE